MLSISAVILLLMVIIDFRALLSIPDAVYHLIAAVLFAWYALVGAYALYYVRKHIKPFLIGLKGGISRLADGDLDSFTADLVIDETTKDELHLLARSFTSLVNNTRYKVEDARSIAEGDLTTYLHVISDRDVLGNALLDMIHNLHRVVSAISAAADQVASGAALVADSSFALSQGATVQASSIQQLTASLAEIGSQTNENAKNADRANELAQKTKEFAAEGNEHMQEMLRAMEDINTSSANISKIIKVIDDIAFQTNILALNAAVEAARAGQNGKGFAVVAEEVRNLAARSANAARETADLIEGSMDKVAVGTKIAANTAEALANIVEQIDRAADLISSIAVASGQQAAAIEQVNSGIQQVSQVVQTNAATSQESAAAAEELSSQAAQLKEAISVFKLRRNQEKKSMSILNELTKGQSIAGKPAPAIKLSAGEFDSKY
jgi:methyl-accepting chemotaxis protein